MTTKKSLPSAQAALNQKRNNSPTSEQTKGDFGRPFYFSEQQGVSHETWEIWVDDYSAFLGIELVAFLKRSA